MGRLQRINRKKRHRKQKKVVPEGRSDILESEPELSRLGTESISSGDGEESSVSLPASPASLSLALSSSFPLVLPGCRDNGHCWNVEDQSGKSRDDHVGHHDEMEMTRRMSSLTFAMAVGMYKEGDAFSTPSCVESGLLGITQDVGERMSETELCSELTSATQLDLLPMLSDREMGQECMEGLDIAQRRARKRPSRRKACRKTKKQRSVTVVPGNSIDRASSPKVVKGTSSSTFPAAYCPLVPNIVRTSSKDAPPSLSPTADSVTTRLSRVRSFRRTRRSKVEEDPLFCFLSDTSVAPETDGPVQSSVYLLNHDMEWAEPYYEATPQEVEEEMEENLLNESDFTETTTDR